MAGTSKEYLAKKFKPGKSGNPNGRPKIRADLKKVKLMSSEDAARLLQKIMNMNTREIQAMVEDEQTPAMEMMIARIITKAINEGDPARLNFLFDRTIGKVMERREIELKPIIYRTAVNADGALIQEVIEEESRNDELEEDADAPD